MIHVFEYMDEKRSSWYLCDLLIKKRIPKRYKDESKFFLCNYSTSIPPYLVENMIMNIVHEGDWPWLTLNNCEYSKYLSPSLNYDRIKKYHEGNIMLYISDNYVFAYERDAIEVALLMNAKIDTHVFDKDMFYVLTAFPFDDLYKCISTMDKHNIGFSFVTKN